MTCDTDPHFRGPRADHVPILTTLELPLPCTESSEACNFQLVDWGTFRESLEGRLADLSPAPLMSEAAFQATVAEATAALQDTIRTSVPLVRLSPHSKCWWSCKLSDLKKKEKQAKWTIIQVPSPARPPFTRRTQESPKSVQQRNLEGEASPLG